MIPETIVPQIGDTASPSSHSFFDRPGIVLRNIAVGGGVPLGIEQVYHGGIHIGGAYGAWGEDYSNARLAKMAETCLGRPLADEERLDLAALGFFSRHHPPLLSAREHLGLEVEAGSRLLAAAAQANGWETSEVAGVLLGISCPASHDYVERACVAAGIPEDAVKVTVHKACAGSVAALDLALAPGSRPELTHRLLGKKVLVGAIEGLSKVTLRAHDTQALQLFASGAGIIGVIPGQTVTYLTSATDEVYDEDGLLQVAMLYPHSGQRIDGRSSVEVTQTGANTFRVAGLMHEPPPGAGGVALGHGGLVRFFTRHGTVVVKKAYLAYRALMASRGTPDRDIRVAITHHANLKINQLLSRKLCEEGACLSSPWLCTDFGNVSAASAMIAFLRALPELRPGDHVLLNGYGAGTYYNVLVVELPG